MRFLAAEVTIGPISASSSMPFLIFRDFVFSIKAGMTRSAAEPTKTATEIAIQRSPAEP